MKIFQICNKPPFPPSDGGAIGINQSTQGFIYHNIDIKLLTVNHEKYKFDKSLLSEEYIKKTSFEDVYINLDINPLKAFLNLFTNKSYNIQRFIDKNFENKIIEILQNNTFDVIQFESLFVTPYIDVIKKHSKAKLVLRAPNIEHWIWFRLADECKNPIKKWYLNLLAKRLKKYELGILNKIDLLATVTEVDAENFKKLGFKKPIISVSTGIDTKILPPIDNSIYNKPIKDIFHLGSMNWLPNIEGVNWFIDKVFPVIEKELPSITMYLAGRNMPESILNKAKENLKVIGEVDNAYDFINQHQIMIVPVRSGGGMRVKIIENLAMGKVIISTTVGAEGISVTNGENILIADNPNEFVECIKKLMNNTDLIKKISSNAIKLASEKYDANYLCKTLINFYQNHI